MAAQGDRLLLEVQQDQGLEGLLHPRLVVRHRLLEDLEVAVAVAAPDSGSGGNQCPLVLAHLLVVDLAGLAVAGLAAELADLADLEQELVVSLHVADSASHGA